MTNFIQLFIYGGLLGFAAHSLYVAAYRRAAIAALLAIVLAFFAPVQFKQQGAVSLEQGGPSFSVPEKVVVPQKSFEEHQAEKYSTLKSESKEVQPK